MNARVPIAFFVYNRPRHTERGLRALARCAELDRFQVHIFCDAPRSDADRELVAAVRAVVDSWAGRLDARVVRRAHNLGLARSIAGSVSELVADAARVVVLEDDLVVAPDFLRFMRAGLDAYEDQEQVAQISGTLLLPEAAGDGDGLFLPLTTTWGWATWERAWHAFPDVNQVSVEALEQDPGFKARFTLGGRAHYADMLQRRLDGENDSWGVLWWYAVARSARLVLYPRHSLVWNGGFDGSGVHCDGDQAYQDEAPRSLSAPWLASPPRLPPRIEPDADTLAQVVDRYFSPAAPGHDGQPLRPGLGRVLARPDRALRRLRSLLRSGKRWPRLLV